MTQLKANGLTFRRSFAAQLVVTGADRRPVLGDRISCEIDTPADPPLAFARVGGLVSPGGGMARDRSVERRLGADRAVLCGRHDGGRILWFGLHKGGGRG